MTRLEAVNAIRALRPLYVSAVEGTLPLRPVDVGEGQLIGDANAFVRRRWTAVQRAWGLDSPEMRAVVESGIHDLLTVDAWWRAQE